MAPKSSEETRLLTQVANDIQWIIKNQTEKDKRDSTWQGKIEAHLTQLNSSVSKNRVYIGKNSTNVVRLWWVIGVLLLGSMGVIIRLVV